MVNSLARALRFAARLPYLLGCLIFFVSVMTPFQLLCVMSTAISVVLSHLCFWILVNYGVPFGILVLAELASPTPNIPFAWNVALAQFVYQAVVVACDLRLLWPVWFLTLAVFVRLPVATYRLVKRALAKVAHACCGDVAVSSDASASTTMTMTAVAVEATTARSLLVGDFPFKDETELQNCEDGEDDESEEDELFFDSFQE